MSSMELIPQHNLHSKTILPYNTLGYWRISEIRSDIYLYIHTYINTTLIYINITFNMCNLDNLKKNLKFTIWTVQRHNLIFFSIKELLKKVYFYTILIKGGFFLHLN